MMRKQENQLPIIHKLFWEKFYCIYLSIRFYVIIESILLLIKNGGLNVSDAVFVTDR